MTPLQIADANLAKLRQEFAQAGATIAEYQSRATVLAAQIAALEIFVAAHQPPAEPEPAPQAVS